MTIEQMLDELSESWNVTLKTVVADDGAVRWRVHVYARRRASESWAGPREHVYDQQDDNSLHSLVSRAWAGAPCDERHWSHPDTVCGRGGR